MKGGGIQVVGMLVGLLFFWPGQLSAQTVSPPTIKPPPKQVYQLTGGAVSLPGLVFSEDEMPDWKLDPSLPVPVRPSSDPGGLQQSAASSFPTMMSSSLWSNFYDVEHFEVSGSHYAVVAMVAGLKFFDLSSGTPFNYFNWPSETGAWVLAVEGTRLYVVDYWESQVHIFDISNPASPNVIGTYTPLVTGRILNIAVANNILYMARNDDGLEIVDCSNPASPAYLTTYGGAFINNGKVKDVAAAGGYVFLSLGNNPANEGEMQVVDVSNPSAPFNFTYTFRTDHVAQIVEHLPGSTFHTKDVVTVAGYPNDPASAGYDIIIDYYSWVAGTGLEYLNSVTLTASGFYIWDAVLFENQAYYALGVAGTAAINITDITAATPVAPTFIGTPTGKFTARGVAVSPADRSILVAESFGGLAQASLLDAGSPLSELSRVEEEGAVFSSYRRGNLLFIASGHLGVTVLDVSNPYIIPQILNRHPTTGSVIDIVVDWPEIYVAERNGGLSVITYDIPGNAFTLHSNISAPAGEEVRSLALKTSGPGAWDYLYAGARTAGVMIIDISDRDAISHVGTIPFTGTASLGSFHLCYLENWDQLAIAQFEDGISVYDLTSPTSPTSAFILTPTLYKSNRVSSDDSGNLWVTDSDGQIDGYDLSTGSPTWLGLYNVGWSTHREIVPFETNAMLAGGWQGMQILNWDDPAAVYEETWVRSAGFNTHNFPGTDFFVMSNTYELAIFETPQDLFLDVQPSTEQYIPVGTQIQYSITGQTGSSWWWVDTHQVDGRDIATIDAGGLLTAVAGGVTRVYGYDDSGRWGVTRDITVQGGNTLVDHTEISGVYNINNTLTFLSIPALTFDEPVEIEIAWLDVSTGIPAPPTGYEALSAYDLTGWLFWSSISLTSGDFNNPVYFSAWYDTNKLPGGIPESAIQLWRYNGGSLQWEQVAGTVVDEVNDKVTVDLQGFSTYAVLAPVTTLDTPTLISPIGGSWINFRQDIELNWNAISGANDYQVEIAIDPAFNLGDIYISGTDDTPPDYLTIGAGDSDGDYYWRVRGTDGATWSAWSETGYFVLDDTPPSVNVSTLPSTMPLNTDVAINANASDNFQLDLIRLYYRSTGDAAWQSSVMNNTGGDSYIGTIPGSYVSWDSFQYLVMGRDGAMNFTFTTADGVPNEGEYGSAVLLFGSLPNSPFLSANRWQMVSIPHVPDDANITGTLQGVGSYGDTEWRFFRWSSGAYRERSQESLQTGWAYWLHHRGSNVHFEIGQGNTVPSGVPFNLTLQSGWNDIASPWLFSVPWDSVLTASGLTDTDVVGTYRYQSNTWALPGASDVLPAWGGVSVYNRTGSNLLIKIPPVSSGTTASLTAGGKTTPVVIDGWQLQLLLSQEGSTGTDNQNYVGVRSDALPDWDPADYPDPPLSLEGTARLAIDHSNRNSDAGHYATDYINEIGEGYAWPLVVESIEGSRKTTLMVRGLSSLPDGYAAALVDVKRNLRIDLDERSPYRFFPADENHAVSGTLVRRSLQLLVGTPVWLDGQTVGIERLPVSVELHPNYPNPFNPSTTIRFSLREATRVKLEIRNVRGQLVKVLANDRFNAGQHTLSWDGTDESGRQVASGIYLTYFQAGGEVRTRKMTLIR